MKFKATTLLTGIALASSLGTLPTLAVVTPYAWIRGGEDGLRNDSSGNNHAFNAAFSSLGGGNPASVASSVAVGGPLGTTGAISTVSTLWGSFNLGNSGMWVQGAAGGVPTLSEWGLPATNWVMECWVLPVGTGGSAGHLTSQIMGTGSGQFGGTPGGAVFTTQSTTDDNGDGIIQVKASSIGAGAAQIGDTALLSTNQWTHLAVVNDNGVTTFYVNGVASGAPSTTVSPPSGVPYIGSGQDTGNPYSGYLDEARYSTFAPGQFAVTDLLLRPPGPSILTQPRSIGVWEGGAAPFGVSAALDPGLTFQWQRSGTNITGAAGAGYNLNVVGALDTGSIFDVVLTSSSVNLTSAPAILTVAPVKTADVNAYRSAVQAESSLIAYFPVDDSTGNTITNTVDASHNATLEGAADYDGRTNRTFGARGLRLQGNGDATIPPNPAYEFPSGNGTIEATIYLDPSELAANENVFTVATGPDSAYYAIQVSPDGGSIIVKNDALLQPLQWAAPVSLLNRFAHIAIVFDNTVNVTAYVDGQSLGAKTQPSFGSATGAAAHIGSTTLFDGGIWNGTIDELAIYNTALSANTIAVHNSKFVNGTNIFAPTITLAPVIGSKTLLAGGSPTFTVGASGTAPLAYQWFFKGASISNATSSTLTLSRTTIASSGEYYVQVSNATGSTNSAAFTLNFVAPPDSYATIVMNDNPSAFWRFDETSGTNAFDVAGGHDGTYITGSNGGGFTLGAPSLINVPNPAVNLSAGSGFHLGGKVQVPYSPTLNPSGPFSIECFCVPNFDGNNGIGTLASSAIRSPGKLGWYMGGGLGSVVWDFGLDSGSVEQHADGGPFVAPGIERYVVGVYDGTDGLLYVDGVLAAKISNPTFVPNPSAPLEIGINTGEIWAFGGGIDEMAFYNYALSPDQIATHFSGEFFISSITQQPVGATNTETGTITLSVGASGFPNTYQWYKGDVALDAATVNADTSLHYQGVNSTNLVILEATPADAGQYHVVITNPLGNQTSVATTVAVTPDTTSPTVTFVGADGTNRVRVAFDRAISDDTVSVTANYSISGGVSISSVAVTTPSLSSKPSVVDLVTSGLTPGQQYTLSVTGVKDTRVSQNLIATNSTSFTASVLTPGILNWDFYENITGNFVDDLRGDPQYPDAVYTNLVLTNFSTSPITGGDLAGNPGFGSLGNNYGSHVYGWLTPKESGNYTFFLDSDDGSELYLSTDANPANVNEIANVSGSACCKGFLEQNADNTEIETSLPIALVANQSYYIEALQKEGGGGDYVRVAMRNEGDTNKANTLQPISGELLSAYAPVVVATLKFNMPTVSAGQVAITWSGTGTLQESTDLQNWTAVAGNPASGYTVTPASGGYKFYRLVH